MPDIPTSTASSLGPSVFLSWLRSTISRPAAGHELLPLPEEFRQLLQGDGKRTAFVFGLGFTGVCPETLAVCSSVVLPRSCSPPRGRRCNIAVLQCPGRVPLTAPDSSRSNFFSTLLGPQNVCSPFSCGNGCLALGWALQVAGLHVSSSNKAGESTGLFGRPASEKHSVQVPYT